jgi:hypothetical protein
VKHFTIAIALTLLSLTPITHAAEPRAARSVHLGFLDAQGDAFYNETVIEKSTDGSYFMVCGWDTGYFGIQQLRGDRKVAIFSVWDPTKGDDPTAVKTEDRVEVLYQSPEARIKRFGGEGTGGQCMIDFNWRLGETNQFLIHAKTETNAIRKTAYTAYIKSPTDKDWRKLATFRVRTKTEGHVVPPSGGSPGAMRGLYSFVEDFRRDTKSVMDERRARFGNAWLLKSDKWTPLTRARFTASNADWESKENIDAGLAENWFYLATGGPIKKTRDLRSIIELPAPPQSPPTWRP